MKSYPKIIDALPVPSADERSPLDTIDRTWHFLQHNFLFLFPISLFLLLGLFALIMVAAP
jgi:hypothetical protein